jgi:predicted DNA-binding transcriptional regulator YafY
MKLFETYKEILLEYADRKNVMKAIDNKNVCRIYYEGDTTIIKGLRVIEPVCFGLSKRNNPVIRAWQRVGVSDSPDNIPGWRMFRLDRIKTFTILDENFNEMKPNFNQNGDKDMVKIYSIASFS